MKPVFDCLSSGISMNQAMHFAELTKYGHFGEFVQNTINPDAFKKLKHYHLSKITAPITLHYSPVGDPTTNPKDIAKLRSKVKSIVYEQVVTDETFMHNDFSKGISANRLVYDYIIKSWEKHANQHSKSKNFGKYLKSLF